MSTKCILSLSTPQHDKKETMSIDLDTKAVNGSYCYNEATDRTHPRNEDVATHVDGRSNPKTCSFESFYCGNEGCTSV